MEKSEMQMATLVAEWACAQMKDFQDGNMRAVAIGIHFQLHEITKQYPFLLESKDAAKYLQTLKEFQIPD